jgi:hypothetical protein
MFPVLLFYPLCAIRIALPIRSRAFPSPIANREVRHALAYLPLSACPAAGINHGRIVSYRLPTAKDVRFHFASSFLLAAAAFAAFFRLLAVFLAVLMRPMYPMTFLISVLLGFIFSPFDLSVR